MSSKANHSGLISATMPALNESPVIAEAIQSIINQTYENWELIVVDNGSTDGTQDIVNGFHDSRIKLLSEPDRGIAKARNMALRHAMGDFIAITDADDICLPHRFAKQVDFMGAHPECSVVSGQVKFLLSSGEILDGGALLFDSQTIGMRLRQGRMVMWHAASMIRKSDIESLDGYSEEIASAEDFHLFLGLLMDGKVLCNMPVPCIMYRVDPASATYSRSRWQDLWNEYARYHRTHLAAGRKPTSFKEWTTSPEARILQRIRHFLRFTRSRVRSYVGQ